MEFTRKRDKKFYISASDYIHLMPAHFQIGAKCDGSKISASIDKLPEQFEDGRKFEGKKLTLMPKKCTKTLRTDRHRSERVVKCSIFEIFECSHDAGLKIYRFYSLPAKKCRFRLNGGLNVTFFTIFKRTGIV